jgi:MFS family permease
MPAMTGSGRVALGSLAGGALAASAAPFLRPFFSVPTGGVGAITVNAYPKGWDYAVIALLILGASAGGAILAWRAGRSAPHDIEEAPGRPGRRAQIALAAAVFILMLFIHDYPYAHMDPFHEGEHLTAGSLFTQGLRPFGDFYIFHGLAADAGLDALALGHPPSPRHVRRLQTVLDAATLALLVPIAAELTETGAGLALGVFASLSGIAALWLPVFPYFRLAPVLLVAIGLLRHARNGRAAPLFLAFASGTLGLLWSLDTGLVALIGAIVGVVAIRVLKPGPRISTVRTGLLALAALVLPIIVLLATHSDIRQFVIDSFIVMPKAVDPIWSLPAPAPRTVEAMRYYLPPVFFGFLFALALLVDRHGYGLRAAQIGIVALLSALLFRTAAGRCSWSHTRYAVPFMGIAVVAFVLEPLMLRRRFTAAIVLVLPLLFYFEVWPNSVAGAKSLAGWRGRQRHEGLVPYPFATGRGLYTSPENASDLAKLNGFIESLGPRDGRILDFSNERALYYLLQRRPATRCMEMSMLSVPRMFTEAMDQLRAAPPVCVILSGYPALASFDGVSNRDRVPGLAAWIDANYPTRTKVGRFVVASK